MGLMLKDGILPTVSYSKSYTSTVDDLIFAWSIFDGVSLMILSTVL